MGDQACQTNDISKIPIVNEENRSLLNDIRSLKDEKKALEIELEAKERLRKLAELSANVKVKFFRNLNILKSYDEKGRTDQRMWKNIVRILGQCKRDLHNLHNECNNYRSYMGKSEEEMCSTDQMFNGFITFTKQAQPAMFKWQELTEKLVKDIKVQKLIRKKNN